MAGRRLRASLAPQSLLFMVGSSLFAMGSAQSVLHFGGPQAANLMFFIGAWFFTAAGLIQVRLSLPARQDGRFRAEWLAAVIQSAGTILFNVSTTAALVAASTRAEREFVWSPDAGGSICFLVSAVYVFAAYPAARRAWDPRRSDWWSAVLNAAGCTAFAASAVGAFVLHAGAAADATVANWGTFVGAVCFFLASTIVLPMLHRRRAYGTPQSSTVPVSGVPGSGA